MTDPVSKKGFGDAALAEKVIEVYARGNDIGKHPSSEECKEMFDIEDSWMRCYSLRFVLASDSEGASMITENEKKGLMQTDNFSEEFVLALAGDDGKRALRERVKWLADHAVTKWWRLDYAEWRRAGLLDELFVLGAEAKEALPQLIWILQNETAYDLVTKAINVIGAIGRDAKEVTPLLMQIYKVLASVDPSVRYLDLKRRIIWALGSVSEPSPTLLNFLSDCAREESHRPSGYPYFGTDVASSLIRLGSAAVPTLSRLFAEGIIDDKNITFTIFMEKSQSWRIQKDEISSMLKILSSGKPLAFGIYEAYAHMMAPLGKEGRVELEKFAQDPNPAISLSAVSILFHWPEMEKERLVLPLTDLMHNSNADIRLQSAKIVSYIGAAAKNAIPILVAMRLNDPNEACRIVAREAIEKIEEKVL